MTEAPASKCLSCNSVELRPDHDHVICSACSRPYPWSSDRFYKITWPAALAMPSEVLRRISALMHGLVHLDWRG
jgi:hypothetical protein